MRALKVFRKLVHEDFRVLIAIERGMATHEHVPLQLIQQLAGKSYDESECNFRLSRLHGMELIKRWKGSYIGYHLTFMGYDCLALNAFVQGNYIESFGNILGIGKEADVFDALDPNKNRIAVKFHRLGRISFRQTKRMRSYISQRRHISWLYTSRISAEREFECLQRLESKVSIPTPITQNRHAIIMQYIPGDVLINCNYFDSPEEILDEILTNIHYAYHEGVIHGDLSEFNIFLTENDDVILFDWPQWVDISHPNADFYLKRDVKNILIYFEKNFGLYKNLDELLTLLKTPP
ncbi:MAG: RIO1 family regulatory kinase/ATPase domain-containing protein [Candidatus Helarchaeota archaeon]